MGGSMRKNKKIKKSPMPLIIFGVLDLVCILLICFVGLTPFESNDLDDDFFEDEEPLKVE